jgi:hypothetical protein
LEFLGLEAAQLTAALDAHAKGLTLAEADALTKANRNPIRTAVDTYLEQKSGKDSLWLGSVPSFEQ